MSMDKSLKSHGSLARHRNVLSRAERVAILADEGKMEENRGVFALPKVPHRKVTTKKIKEAVAGAEGAPAAGEAAPAAAAGKAPAGGKAPAAAAGKAPAAGKPAAGGKAGGKAAGGK